MGKWLSLRHVIILPSVLILTFYQFSSNLFASLNVAARQHLGSQTPHQHSSRQTYKEITFTNFGWFQADEKEGLKVGRSWHAKDFMDAVLAHERFNQSTWEDLDRNPDSSRPILAFLDIDTCNDLHYPRFGMDFNMASDRQGGRERMRHWDVSYSQVCPTIERALHSPAMAAPESRLIVLSCEGMGPRIANCTGRTRNEEVYSKLVVGHLSAHKSQVHRHDFGIPPMPVKAVTLNKDQLEDIHLCRVNQSRPYLFSFQGRGRKGFPEYKSYWTPLHGKERVRAVFTLNHYKNNPTNLTNAWGGKVLEALPPQEQTQDMYYKLLMESVFAGAPRGDNLYSVRFSEILSAATIPVVYADGWVLPFTRDVVDWSDLAVLLPQKNVSQTMNILKSMSSDEICQRQKRIHAFYKDYIADCHGRLRAVLKIMDARLKARAAITPFSAAPGDQST